MISARADKSRKNIVVVVAGSTAFSGVTDQPEHYVVKSKAHPFNSSAVPFSNPRRLFAIFSALLCFSAGAASAIPLIGTDGASLIRFDSTSPGTVTTISVAPRQPGESLLAIDYRPATGELLAVTSFSRLLRINPSTGATTLVGSITGGVSGTNFGMDFNPLADIIRLVSDSEQNLRIMPGDGTAFSDTALNPAGNVVAIAYDRNYTRLADDETRTTLFGIDATSGRLVRIGSPDGSPKSPNTGEITAIGPLFSGDPLSGDIGFDIATDGVAYASLNPGGGTRLYTIDLTTGAATFAGVIGNGSIALRGLTSVITAPLFVTNTNDSGAGSLRQAILDSNASTTVDDIIKFNISGAGPHTIAPVGSSLPVITDTVAIDGKSEPDFDAATQVPVVVVDGTGTRVTGLSVSEQGAGGSVIQGLRVVRFTSIGVRVSSAPNVVVRGNHIGTDGTLDVGSVFGVRVLGEASAGTRIGGSSAGDRNVIAGNAFNVQLEGTANIVVQGNYIGTNAGATAAVDSLTGEGIQIADSPNVQIGGSTAGEGNVISGVENAIHLYDGRGATIQGNLIGTNAAGTAAIPNRTGILLDDRGSQPEASVDCVVGGTMAAAANVISGNDIGINVTAGSARNRIEGNLIGRNAANTGTIANRTGVLLSGGAANNVVGGTAEGAGNTISGNEIGVHLGGCVDNSVQRNSITSNSFAGVLLDGLEGPAKGEADDRVTERNTIGGSAAAGNGISGNGGPGVLVESDHMARLNPIRFNSITQNTGLRIDLAPGTNRGITPNDVGDSDTGPHGLQNFPVLTAAVEVPGGVAAENVQGIRVEGGLNSTPNSSFLIDCYIDQAGGGGIQLHLGTIAVTTDAEGNVTFNETLPMWFVSFFPPSSFNVIATATTGTAAAPGETSEYSAGVPIRQAGGVRFTQASYEENEDTGNVTIEVERVNGTAGTLTVQYSTVDGSATQPDDYTAASGTITFAPGQLSESFTVSVNDDAKDEENETFVVALSNASAGATIETPSSAALTIVDNDLPPPPPTATVSPTPAPTATPTVLGNIATRLGVETGDNVLIGGFIVTGTQPKKLMVRAMGPSSGVDGALEDPLLEMYDGSGQLFTSNDNWEDAENRQEIIDSTIAPNHPLEAAFLASLPPGNYTAVVSGVNGGTGIGVVEAYDLDRGVDSKLANIATRGVVKTGDNVMIGGLIILGDNPQKVIIRAIGPSLEVEGKLADPTLDLINEHGESLAFNNNWRDDQQTAIEETTIPPSHDLEAAIVATLPPAPYTAVVRGSGDGTGIALVEVYALD